MLDETEYAEEALLKFNFLRTKHCFNHFCDECCLPFADYGYNPILTLNMNDAFAF